MAPVRQTSFASGELSRSIQGRTDLELFRHGARKLLNFVVNRQGSAVSRPGTRLCWAAGTGQVVLVPFVLPDSSNARVLEFGNLYCRIYDAGTWALAAPELVTPFVTGDLRSLQWAQAGNVLTVTCNTREPQEITIAAASATIFPVRYGPPGETLGAAPLEAVMPSIGGNPPAMPVLGAWQPTSLFVVDAAHPPREWKYKVSTLVRNNATGLVVETLPRDVTEYSSGDASTGTIVGPALPLPADNLLILFSDAPIYIAPGYGAATPASANWTPEEYVYYRGRGRLFGLIGSTRSNAYFADFADEPDYLTPPLRGESPFEAGEYPAAVAFFQQRRALAGTRARGNTWWASAVSEFANYDEPVINWPGQPLEATLIGDKREKIVSMVELEHLFVLTDSAVWCIGRKDVPLDFDTFPSVCRPVDKVGSLPIMPLVVDGNVLLYPRSEGRGLRALQQGGQDGFAGVDVTWHADHLFLGLNKTVVSWCYARDPWGVAWVVRDDGVLLSVTRSPDGNWAWAKHETDNQQRAVGDGGDYVISVCSVPAGAQGDVVFAAIVRGGVTRIERLVASTYDAVPRYFSDPDFDTNVIGSPQNSYPLDGCVVATVIKATGATMFTLGQNLSHLEGRYVWASCPGIEPLGPLLVTAGDVTIPPGSWGPDINEAGWVLIGSPNGTFAAWVAAGRPGDPYATFTAAFGLAFTCDLGLLDAAPGTLNQKSVVKVGFEVDNAQGIEVGEDFDHLVPWQQRRVVDQYAFPSAASTLADVNVKGSWNLQGRAVLRQAKPLSVTVLGITRELAPGGK